MSRRWHRVLFSTPALWHPLYIDAPKLPASQWTVEEQEAWLAAKLSQLRRVSPVARALVVGDTAGVDVMPEMLHTLTASHLTSITTWRYAIPPTAAAMRALASLTGLQDATLGNMGHVLPAHCGWAVGQLTGLSSLTLEFERLAGELPAALAHLPYLDDVTLRSAEPLPDVQPLTALEQLQLLKLSEEAASEGLEVLSAAHFPDWTYASFQSPHLKVGTWRMLHGRPLFTAFHLHSARTWLSPAGWQHFLCRPRRRPSQCGVEPGWLGNYALSDRNATHSWRHHLLAGAHAGASWTGARDTQLKALHVVRGSMARCQRSCSS